MPHREHPLPDDEHARLAALRNLDLLDTPPEPGFDRITQMASRIFDVPIALVSLIDEDRQWFKSACGIDTPETPRSHAFCAHTIVHRSTMVVDNALEDERFRHNPLVTGSPHIRFYAGAPLITAEGHALGSLCIIDTEPRSLDDEWREILEALAETVLDQMELRVAVQEAKRAVGERTELVGMVTHEIRNPLTGALGFAELLADDMGLTGEAQEMAETVRDGIRDADSIISDLLTFSRMDRNRFEVDLRPVTARDEIAAVVDSLENAAGKVIEVCPETEVTVEADPLRFRQVVRNLVSNAVRYGGDHIWITARADGPVTIVVADNGAGLDEDTASGLFEPFTRGTSGRRNPQSSGLGLAVSRRLARAMGGDLHYRRSDGTTRFELTLSTPAD